MTVLHYAAKAGHVDVLKVLLESDEADINMQVSVKLTAPPPSSTLPYFYNFALPQQGTSTEFNFKNKN